MLCYGLLCFLCFMYCLHYLQFMSKLPGPVIEEFMKGNHVMRHHRGIWNGLWSDLYIETTFMRYGHSPGGIVGITLQSSTLKRWALTLHYMCPAEKRCNVSSDHDVHHTITTHKEESTTRIMTDSVDKGKIRQKSPPCIDPEDPSSHPSGSIVKIITGMKQQKRMTSKFSQTSHKTNYNDVYLSQECACGRCHSF